MIANLTPTEQAPAATPPRRTTPVVAREQRDWTWTFAPPVPADLAGRLAGLAAEMACAAGQRDELEGYALRDRDPEWDLAARRQEALLAAAFDDALRLGVRLIVRPAVGRPREREE